MLFLITRFYPKNDCLVIKVGKNNAFTNPSAQSGSMFMRSLTGLNSVFLPLD